MDNLNGDLISTSRMRRWGSQDKLALGRRMLFMNLSYAIDAVVRLALTLSKSTLDLLLGVRIERSRCLMKEHNLWLPEDCAGYSNLFSYTVGMSLHLKLASSTYWLLLPRPESLAPLSPTTVS